MALQPRIIACGNTVATFAAGVRFITGPAVMAAASIAVGLKGTLLHVAIVQVIGLNLYRILLAMHYSWNASSLLTSTLFGKFVPQAALPQGIVPFVFAKEYNVHPDILSTAY